MNRIPPQPHARLSSPLSLALINQLGYPGLGTIMAGKKIGWLQATLMTLGLVAYFIYFYLLLQNLSPLLAEVISGARPWDYNALAAAYRPHRWLGQLALGCSLLAWFWSLLSSIHILRNF